jgi:hypothetical protein
VEQAGKPLSTSEAVVTTSLSLFQNQSQDLFKPLFKPLFSLKTTTITTCKPVVVVPFANQVNVAADGVIVEMVMLIVETVVRPETATMEETTNQTSQNLSLSLFQNLSLYNHNNRIMGQSCVVDNLVAPVAANGDIVV